MPLVPYEPCRHFEHLRRELERLIASDSSPFNTGFEQVAGSFNDHIKESDNEITVYAIEASAKDQFIFDDLVLFLFHAPLATFTTMNTALFLKT